MAIATAAFPSQIVLSLEVKTFSYAFLNECQSDRGTFILIDFVCVGFGQFVCCIFVLLVQYLTQSSFHVVHNFCDLCRPIFI